MTQKHKHTYTHSSFYYLSSLEPPPFQRKSALVPYIFCLWSSDFMHEATQCNRLCDTIWFCCCYYAWRWWLRECLWAPFQLCRAYSQQRWPTIQRKYKIMWNHASLLSVSMPHWNNNANLWSTVFTAWICTCTKRQPHSPWWQSQWYYGFFPVYFHYAPLALFTTIIHKTKD